MRPDARLPHVSPLLGPGAAHLLGAALAPTGVEVLRARPTQVRYDPGRRLVVRYATTVRELSGAERVDTMVAVADRDGPPPGAAVLAGEDGGLVGVWRYPNDPRLPGLRSMVYAEGARHVLAQVGLHAPEVRVEPVVYRPGQRAVLRVTVPSGRLYAKLVRPHRAERVHRTYQALAGHAPVPRSLGFSAAYGLVLLEALPGDGLARRLSAGGALLPPPAALVDLLDGLAGAGHLDAAPLAPSEAAAAHARLLRAVVPHERGLVDEIAAFAAVADLPADRTVHGDFYEGQILVRHRQVTGLLDVDGARPGSAADDLATLAAHLDALALVRPAVAPRIAAYRRAVERVALERVETEVLHAAVAGVLLGLATGPFRLQEDGWPRRTGAWLQLARRVLPAPGARAAGRDERALTDASSVLHAAGSS